MRPSELLKILGEPGTGAPLDFRASAYAGDEPYSGALFNAVGLCVGVLTNFQFDFLSRSSFQNFRPTQFPPTRHKAMLPKRVDVPLDSSRIVYAGETVNIGGRLMGINGTNSADKISIHSAAAGLDLQFYSHGWSGRANIYIDGKLYETVDLFNLENSIPHTVRLDLKARTGSQIDILSDLVANAGSMGRQIILERVFELDGTLVEPKFSEQAERNYGGEFKSRFFEILRALPVNAVVLDVGGGKRAIDDQRYVNLEYSRYEEPAVFGDGKKLPFRSSSVDFVYTAAVLEHINDPLLVGAEIYRVLKPGGWVLANSAFMQPVHSEGQHFFNATCYGIREIFRDFPEGSVSWEGGLFDMLEWIVNISGVKSKAQEDELDAFMRFAKKFDKLVTYDRLMYIASGVWFEGQKPL